jgi:dipeptidase D
MNISHEKTKTILHWFEEINKIPRCSKNESAIAAWLCNWAEEHNFEYKKDPIGNVLFNVPATAGYEKSPIVVIQGHMDMVCEKTKDSTHDFEKDPIGLVYEDGWLKADRTTLGADNGIAMAMALTAATATDVPHPPLELLFTVDEETGLNGAVALEPGFVEGKILLNVDSEDEGVFTVGCAGGKDSHVTLPIQLAQTPKGFATFRVIAEGMRGGHSGVDIHQQRANALKILNRTLISVAAGCDLRLVNFQGGTAHNAIPRDAEAVICLPNHQADKARNLIAEMDARLKAEYVNNDPKITVSMNTEKDATQALSAQETNKILDFIMIFPHGVYAMSTDIEGLVETSNNLATIKTGVSQMEFLTSQRSSNMDRLDLISFEIEALARLAGGQAETNEGYPAWMPNMDSPLLAKCQSVYKGLFGKEGVVEIIHAGLECGIIGAKYEGMDMISFGPTLKNPHSPDEKIEISAISNVWDFMAELMKTYK